MKLKKLIADLDIIGIQGNVNIDIEQVTHDSRKTRENSLFVAIDGYTVDGHNFIKEAIKKGAKAVIVQKDITLEDEVTIIKVKDTRIALARTSSIFYGEPSKKLNLVGVTGTNGKTSTTYFIKTIFETDFRKTGVIGTIGSVIGEKILKVSNTTPESVDLQHIFSLMLEENVDNCIMEVSSHSLEMKRVEYCDFNVGIFTNLSVDHLDFHQNIENYLEAKQKLFYKTRDFNIINIDDYYGQKIYDRLKSIDIPIITYGLNNKADIWAKNITNSVDGVKFILVTPKEEIEIKMKVPGLFTVYNALASAACGFVYNINLETIKKGLESVKGVKGRFEVVPTDRDFSVIIDFAHTPDGLEKVLNTIKEFAKGRIVVVFGAGGDRDRSKRPVMGEIAAKYSDLCIVTSDNSRSEDPQKIINDIVKGIERVNGNYVSFIDREEAIKYAIKNSKPDDIILLAGKGHETYQIIGNNVFPFDERKIVLNTLKEIY